MPADVVTPTTIAAAFVVGSIAGFVAAVRLFRLVLEYMRDRNKD